jgi:hypothetical protein
MGKQWQWFWLLVTVACVVWYSTITIYVAVKGVLDIKGMLRRLGAKRDELQDNKEEDGLSSWEIKKRRF